MPKGTGVVNDVRNILHCSNIGLTVAQILNTLDVDKHPQSTIQSICVILSQLKTSSHVQSEKTFCNCCMRNMTVYYITESGRMAITENTGVIDTPTLEEYINATSNVEHVEEVN